MSKKRLYRVRQGAMISGVCQGIANYFGMDATIIRLIWVIGSILVVGSFGLGIWIYILCSFIIPKEPVMPTEQKKSSSSSSIFDSTDYVVKDAEK
ncbi:MAG: PspC domain-containing protein [Turicibacter sp.]|nr:PspC domain-containing protein [Turicibacter sp.]